MKTYKDFCKEVASEQGWSNLVTGHRVAYWEDAAIRFAKYCTQQALSNAVKNSELSIRKLGAVDSYTITRKEATNFDLENVTSVKVNEQSISNALPLEKIK